MLVNYVVFVSLFSSSCVCVSSDIVLQCLCIK